MDLNDVGVIEFPGRPRFRLELVDKFLVVHEVTNGPFDRDRTVLAPFAPSEDQADQARDYMKGVAGAVAEHLKGSRP